jgi:hypothetical protein
MADQKESRRSLIVALLAGGLTLWYVVGLLTDRPYWLRGVEWTWRRRIPGLVGTRFVALLIVGGVWLGLVAWLLHARHRRWARHQVALLLAGMALFTPCAQLTIAAQHASHPLAVALLTTIAPTSGFFSEGVAIQDPLAFVRDHVDRMPGYRGVHLRTQPPGWPLAFWSVRQLWGLFPQAADWVGHFLLRLVCGAPELQGLAPDQVASATLQMSVMVWAGLGVLPLYGLGLRLFSAHVGRMAAVMYPLLPGLLVFHARFDAFYVVLTLAALWLAHRVLESGRWRDILPLALLLAGVTLFGFGPLAITALVNILVLAHLLVEIGGAARARVRTGLGLLLRMNIPILLALALLWGGLWLCCGVSWMEMWATSQEIHRKVRLAYPVWPLFNLYDLAVFMGLPLMVWALVEGVVTAIRVAGQSRGRRDAFVLVWLFSLLVLCLSGMVRAETGRLLLFMLPPGLLIGVAALDRRPGTASGRRGTRLALQLMLALFGLQALVTGLFLGGRAPMLSVPPVHWSVPSSAEQVSYLLGEAIALEGYEVRDSPGGTEVVLYWRALAHTETDYSVFVHLLRNGTDLVAQSDGYPVAGELPTQCWVGGEVVVDIHRLPSRPQAGGEYLLGVGMYDWRTGIRLPVTPPAERHVILLPLPKQ